MAKYSSLFTWSHFLDDQFLVNHDGSVSCFIEWKGIQTELSKNESDLESKYYMFYNFLNEISKENNIVVENHFSRLNDISFAKKYIEYGEKNIVRSRELGLMLRNEMADHLSGYARVNTITTVFTIPVNLFQSIFSTKKKNLKNSIYYKNVLTEIVERATTFLDDYKVLNKYQIGRFLKSHVDLNMINKDGYKGLSDEFYINELIVQKPILMEDGILQTENNFTKVILLIDYPDAKFNWFNFIASLPVVDVQVTQILKPLNRSEVVRKSASQSNKSNDSASVVGGEDVAAKIIEHSSFRDYLAAHDSLTVFDNCYVIKLSHSNLDILKSYSADVLHRFTEQGATYEHKKAELAYHFWRTSSPAQGYKSTFFREDQTWEIGNMAPIIKYDEGDTEEPMCLRLTNTGTLVGDSYPADGAHHKLVAAKTGSGKTVSEAAEILELFPLGYNFYVGEVGRGFEWIIELFGGEYYALNADNTVISPFPLYELDLTDTDEDGEEIEISASITGVTVNAIMPILMGRSDFEKENLQHHKGAAETIFQGLYMDGARDENKKGPTLETFLNIGRLVHDILPEPQKIAATEMLDNLDSFLSRSEGAIFKKSDTIDFSKPIIGVDFSELIEGENNDLAKYMFSFVAMRFKQLAFSNKEPTFCKFDEYHEFTNIDPILTDNVARQMTRRGRKKSGYFNPISQEIGDMSSKGLNQFSHKSLMYYGSDFGDIPSLLSLSDKETEIWKGFREPLGAKLDFRQCLLVKGDNFYNLHLTWPQLISDLTNSNPTAVQLKERLNIETDDVMERVSLFREQIREIK
jgi:hypothetical protein